MSFIKASGLYKGIVVDNQDPSGKFHRVRVRIPKFHGTINQSSYKKNSGSYTNKVTAKYVSDNSLPWCEVAFPFGSDIVPEIGQVVIVGFINADVSQPVVLGWIGCDYTDKEEPFTPTSSIDI